MWVIEGLGSAVAIFVDEMKVEDKVAFSARFS